MRDACKDLTQNEKCTPTNMHHAIGVMWSHQRLSAHFKIRNFKFSAARARAAACCMLRCAACCSVIQQRQDLHDAARAADAREARLFKNVIRGQGGSSSAGRSPAIWSLPAL